MCEQTCYLFSYLEINVGPSIYKMYCLYGPVVHPNKSNSSGSSLYFKILVGIIIVNTHWPFVTLKIYTLQSIHYRDSVTIQFNCIFSNIICSSHRTYSDGMTKEL